MKSGAALIGPPLFLGLLDMVPRIDWLSYGIAYRLICG